MDSMVEGHSTDSSGHIMVLLSAASQSFLTTKPF